MVRVAGDRFGGTHKPSAKTLQVGEQGSIYHAGDSCVWMFCGLEYTYPDLTGGGRY